MVRWRIIRPVIRRWETYFTFLHSISWPLWSLRELGCFLFSLSLDHSEDPITIFLLSLSLYALTPLSFVLSLTDGQDQLVSDFIFAQCHKLSHVRLSTIVVFQHFFPTILFKLHLEKSLISNGFPFKYIFILVERMNLFLPIIFGSQSTSGV